MNYKNFLLKKTHFNKMIHLGIISFFIIFSYKDTKCQSNPPNQYEMQISYTETEDVSQSVEDLSALKPWEVLKLKTRSKENQYHKYLLGDGSRYTIIEHKKAENIYPKWAKRPTKTVIDKNGTHIYDKNEKILKSITHSQKYKELSEILSTEMFPTFNTITDQRIRELKSKGANIEKYQDGSFKVITQKNTIYINPNLLYFERIKKNDNGKIISHETKSYIELQPGYIVPERFTKIIYTKTKTSKVCKEIFQNKLFTNYSIIDNRNGKKVNINKDEININNKYKLSIIPNPAKSVITIESNFFDKHNDNYTISIYNNYGQLKYNKIINNKTINISNLKSGIYIIKLSNNKQTIQSKFVKL